MIGKSRWTKIIVISTLVGAVLGGGIASSRYWLGVGAEKLLNRAKTSYAKGLDAFQAGDAATAVSRFEEANLQANKALAAIEHERKKAGGNKDEQEHLTKLEGQILWLKSQALRDAYFAKAGQEGKPLPETTDPLSGDKFRSVLLIPDAQARNEAFGCLREAANRVEDKDVLRQALLTETMLPALDWPTIERVARRTLQVNPKDPWALYLLARFEFEQPPTNSRAAAVPKSKRSRERILQARAYVKQLKDNGNYPLWRTLYLEAEIDQWMRVDAAQANSPRRDAEDATLRSLLFGPKGALARAATGEGLEYPSKWDAEGVLGLHQLALDLAVEDSRQPGTSTDKVVELLAATLALCQKLADKDSAYVAECALSAIAALSKAEPVLVSEPPPDWNKHLELAQSLVGKARERKLAQPTLYQAIADLLAREAHIEGKRGHSERRAELNKQALKWVEDGLRLGTEAKLPPAQLATLYALAAEMKTIGGAKPEQITEYLNGLRESKTSRGRALAALLEAAGAEREGRLTDARKQLEQVLGCGETDLVLRAHMVLGGVYLALGQPDKALASLRQTEQAYEVLDRLSPQEKAWALEFVRSPEDLALLTVAAHVESALAAARAFTQRNPGKPLPLESLRHHEKAINEQRKYLAKQTPQDRQARQIMVGYYAATGRNDLAERELSELRGYYPNRVEVLRTEVRLAMSARDAAGRPRSRADSLKDADGRIEQFLKDHPADLDARFFWVEWLIGTQRMDEALAYLQSPANFADTKSERYQRVLAMALLAKGDREGSQKVLEHLPHNAGVDALLIQAASAADREKLLQQALSRYEGNAQLLTWQAILAFNKRDYQSAADTFLRVSRYNRYEETGKRGLLQSLLALARTDPAKARQLGAQMFKKTPDEPMLLLACAYASLLLDDIGTPGDSSDPVKSMAAALNDWEQMILEQQPRLKATVPLTKAEFWSLAGRQDLALAEVVRVLNLDRKNPDALRLAVVLALELRNPDLRAATRKRLDLLKEARPDDANVRLLEARFDESTEQPKEAIAVYEAALKNDPKLNDAYARLINLLLKQGDKAKTREYVQRWRKEQPHSVPAMQAEVRLLAENKEAGQVRKLVETFIDQQLARERKRLEAEKPAAGADPKETEKARQDRLERFRLRLQLDLTRGLMQGKAWSEAGTWLNEVLAKHPDDVTTLVLLGDLHVSQQSWDKARVVYEKVLALDKTNGVAGNNLAWILAKHLNKAPEALRLVQEARKGRFSHKPISGDRLRPEFLDTLGLIYTKMEKGSLYADMRDVFEAARHRWPHDPRICAYLGNAYAGLLEMDRAERWYAAAIEIANKSGQQFLSPQQCKEVIDEVHLAQKKIKQTAQR